jgi:hypothetical protein
VGATEGRTLDQKRSARAITAALASAGDPKKPIQLPVDVAKVHVDKAAAQRALDQTVAPALSAPVSIQGSDGTKAQVPVSAIAASLTFTPKDDGTLAVAIDPAAPPPRTRTSRCRATRSPSSPRSTAPGSHPTTWPSS